MSKTKKQPKDLTRRNFALGAIAGATGAALASTSSLTNAQHHESPSEPVDPNYISANDRLDIIELMAVYAWNYDCSDEVAFANTFTLDGSIDIFGKELAKGREALQEFIKTGFKMRGNHGWQHLTDHHHFKDFDGKSCTVYSYYLMPESDGEGANVHLRAMGYYISHCVKDGHKWFFKKREVLRWNGKIPWSA